jgi:hypothetical protein
MKRLASLVAVVFALAIVPVALADDGGTTGTTPSTPAAASHGGAPIARLRLDILRLRLDLVHLRYRVACRQADSDRCTQFTQKIVDRLTTLDGNIQKKLGDCKADKACTVLQKIDDRIKKVIDKLSNPSSTDDESGLDQAAGDLAGLAKP